MVDASRRKALKSQYRETTQEIGVYRFVNTQNGRFLIGSSTNLPSIANKLTFAQSVKSTGIFDYRMKDDIRQFGIDAIAFEILETYEPSPEMTPAQIKRDLAALEELWLEKLGRGLSY